MSQRQGSWRDRLGRVRVNDVVRINVLGEPESYEQVVQWSPDSDGDLLMVTMNARGRRRAINISDVATDVIGVSALSTIAAIRDVGGLPVADRRTGIVR